MNFKQFREMLRGQPVSEPEAAEPEIAFVEVRRAMRSESMTLKVKAGDLVRMILLAAGEPERPYGSATFQNTSPCHGLMSGKVMFAEADDPVTLTLSTGDTTAPVAYAEKLP